MARVLAYTTPARGHLFPVTPILDELRDGTTRSRSGRSPRRSSWCAAAASTRRGRPAPSSESSTTTTALAPRSVPRSAPCAWPAGVLARRRGPPARDRRRRARTPCWSTSTPGARWPSPRPGAAPGPRGVPIRSRCRRRTPRHSGRACVRRAGLRAGCGTRRSRPLVFGSARTDRASADQRGPRARRRALPINNRTACSRRATAPPSHDRRAIADACIQMACDPLHIRPVDPAPLAGSPTLAEEMQPRIVLVTTSSEFQDDGRLVRSRAGCPGRASRSTSSPPCSSNDPAGLRHTGQRAARSPSSHTARSSTVPRARSRTAAWAPPRKRSRAAFRYAPSRSGATSSKSRAVSSWPARARGFRPGASAPSDCAPRSGRRSAAREVRAALPRAIGRPADPPRPQTPSRR